MKTEQCVADLFLTNPYSDRAKHVDYKGNLIPSACTWITKNESYNKWNDSTQKFSQILWLSGRPGSGTTMLAIFLTEEIERRLSVSSKTILLYYFCDSRHEKRNTVVSILRGLIFQLITQQPALVKILLQDYRILRDRLFADNSFEALWKIFECMILEINDHRFYCIIDGLDECKNSSLDLFIKNIKIFFDQSPISEFSASIPEKQRMTQNSKIDLGQQSVGRHNVDFRMLITSQDDHEYWTTELGEFSHLQLSIDAADYHSDLKSYINVRANEFSTSITDTKLDAATISAALSARGDGTLLWVNLALENLNRAASNSLQQTLNHMPLTVEEIYHQALLSIADNSKYLAAALLRWMVMVVRPLQLSELEVGLGLSTGASINQITLRKIIDSCGSLIVVRESEVSLVHQTARNFLLLASSSLRRDPRLRQFHSNEEAAHSEIAQACLTYLAHGSLARGPIQVITTHKSSISKSDQEHLTQFPFLSYATINWTKHARCSAIGNINFTSPFFHPVSAIRDTWWSTYWISTFPASTWRWTAPAPFSLLHLAAYFGILPLAVSLENQGLLRDQIGERDNHSNRAILYAVENGHLNMVSFLLNRGASKIQATWLNNMDAMEEPLLHCAAKLGDAKLVSLLLDHGEQVNEAFDNKWDLETNEAYIATLATHLPGTAKEITETWYNRERRSSQLNYGQDETALHVAVSCGHDSVVLRLLEAGANISAQTTGGWTALHNAAWFGKASTIQILLAHGADVMAECDHKWTPLHYAAHQNQRESVKLLLENGAQVDARSSKQKTALHVACSGSNLEVVKVLLEHNADLESRTIAGATPLHVAVWAGYDTTVKFLLDHGANKTALNRGCQTPEKVALIRGHSNIASMLKSYVMDEYSATQEGKGVHLETTSSTPTSPAKATSIYSNNGSDGLRELNVTQNNSSAIVEGSDLPELFVADTRPELGPNPAKQLGNFLGYEDGLIPMTPEESSFVPTATTLKTSSDNFSTSFGGLTLNKTSSAAESPSTQPPPTQILPTYESPIIASPREIAKPHSRSVSSPSQSTTNYPPPPPYSEHLPSTSQQTPNTQFNPYFQNLSVDASAPFNQVMPPPPSQLTSPISTPPAIYTSPPPTQPQSPINSLPNYVPVSDIGQSLSYSPSSYPLPPSRPSLPSQSSSGVSDSSTLKYKKSPPPLPPRSPTNPPLSNRPIIENVSQYHNYQQTTAQPQSVYASPIVQDHSSFTQNLNQTYSHSQPESLQQVNGSSQYLTSPIAESQFPTFTQNPVSNHSYSHSRPPLQANGPNFSFPPSASPQIASSQGPTPQFAQTSPYMGPAVHASPPTLFGLSPGFVPNRTFAPPPTGSGAHQPTSFGVQALRKSNSFLNINILGKKIL